MSLNRRINIDRVVALLKLPERGSRMPRVLISNNHLANYGGSEMVTLELCEEFTQRGWHVDVYANHIDAPFRKEFEYLIHKFGLRLFNPVNFANDSHYDLIWIHHSVLPDSVIWDLATRARLPRIIWHHMSPFAGIESPILADIENSVASVSTFISKKTREFLLQFGVPVERTSIFPNPVPRAFTQDPLSDLPGSEIERVVLISNHPPAEILDAAKGLRERGIIFDHVGSEHPSRVTPFTFQGADALITIGKSVQYALCLGIPVYVYDHFGGEGWLTEKNFETEGEYNFSGRSTERKLSGSEIEEEIRAGYKEARMFAQQMVHENRKRYGIETQLDELMSEVSDRADNQRLLSKAMALRWATFSNMQRDNTIALQSSWKLNSELDCLSNEQVELIHKLEDHITKLTQSNSDLRQSKSYQVGNLIMRPLSFFKGIISRL